MITLGIDTANQPLAIGVVEDHTVLGQIQINKKKNHSLTLMPALDQLFASIQLKPSEIDRIAVSSGPGSYTGLRIGVTTAKTLADTLNKELVGVSSLAAIAANCVGIDAIIVPIFDARRKNVYAGAYRHKGQFLETVLDDLHIAFSDLIKRLAEFDEPIFFVGSDCQKFAEEISEGLPQAIINPNASWDLPSGSVIAELGARMEPVTDIQAFLPRYLKKVEAEEKWLETHSPGEESYVEKI
ncbi:tRNA (adenosine(37)-N6)-threonylcarbamoyltransferase complex dimerization subunit type 1 TsaB [Enterococcus hirae]|nr:tRNA (adenosine(37)-N6)-threonylcarbamoyltransferase complex dimerization subunit type 1 TsaB [Enterococcus hirae]